MNYHILKANDSGTTVTVVMHIPTPAGLNFNGKAFNDCLVEDTDHLKISILPSNHLTAGEDAALLSGTLVEVVENFRTHPDIPNVTKRNRLDALYLDTVVKTQAAIVNRYWGWSFGRTA